MTDPADTALAAVTELRAQRDAAQGDLADAVAEQAADQRDHDATVAGLKATIADLQAKLDPGVLPAWGAPTWRDEFTTGLGPDWNVRTRATIGLGIDAGIPDASMVTVSDGVLHIRSEWLPDAPVARTASASGVKVLTHKTGYLDLLNRKKPGDHATVAQRWGRFEARIKPDTGPNTRGALCAFWLRNETGGEIDISESWGYGGNMANAADFAGVKDTGKLTIFTNTNDVGSRIDQCRWRDKGLAFKAWEDFHTVGFELLPDRASYDVDGQVIWTATPKTLPGLWSAAMNSPWHPRLNTHVGPSEKWYGIPSAASKALTKPLDFQVEHVRLYAYTT